MFAVYDNYEDNMYVPGETYLAGENREYYLIITTYIRDGEFFELQLCYEIELAATQRSFLGTPIQCWDKDEARNIICEFGDAISKFDGEEDVQQADMIAVWEEFLNE